MNYCSACGGLLGRDCWNEQDCLMISENNKRQDPNICRSCGTNMIIDFCCHMPLPNPTEK